MATNTNTNITRQAQYIEDKMANLLASTQSLVNKPYSQYGGQRLAGFSGDQLDAFTLARQGIGAYAPYLANAGDYANYGMQSFNQIAPEAANYARASGQWDPNAIQNYMNPYQQNVIDTTLAEMNRQHQLDQNQLDASAAQAGAFGGSRHGVAEAEMLRGFDQNRNQAMSQLYNQGYTNAQNQYQQHLQNMANTGQQLGALGEAGANLNLDTSRIMSGLGGLAQQYNQGDATMLAQIGGMQQGQTQAQMDIDYNNFLESQMQPYQRLGFFSDILRGTPSTQSTLTTSSTPQKSQLAQGLGALGQFASTGQTFGWWGNDTGTSGGTS